MLRAFQEPWQDVWTQKRPSTVVEQVSLAKHGSCAGEEVKGIHDTPIAVFLDMFGIRTWLEHPFLSTAVRFRTLIDSLAVINEGAGVDNPTP